MLFSFLVGLFLISNGNIFEVDEDLPEELIHKEILEELKKDPIDLNKASLKDLLKIPYLDPVLAKRIIKNRKYRELEDLLKVPGLDKELLEKISKFVKVEKPPRVKVRRLPKSGEVKLRMINHNFSPTDSLIDYKVYSRVKGRYGGSEIVLISEKDPEESKYLDFLSYSLAFSSEKRKLILGNYLVGFGQGLIFSSPYEYISSSQPSLAMGHLWGLRPYILSSENKALCGVTYQESFGRFIPTLFLSYAKLDAYLNNDSTVERISYSGIHTDSNRIKDILTEKLLGLHIGWRGESSRWGITGYKNFYDKSIAPEDSLYSFYGNTLTLLGLDGMSILGDYSLFGEIGYSLKNGWACVGGLSGDWGRLRIGFNLRTYSNRFFSPHGRNYSLRDRRESLGSYFFTRYKMRNMRFYFYGNLSWDPLKDSIPTWFRLRVEKGDRPLKIGLVFKENLREEVMKTQGVRLDIDYQLLKPLSLCFRIEDKYSQNKEPAKGYLLFLGEVLRYRGIRIDSRFYWFDIPSYHTRIYAYESSLPGFGGSYSFYGRGWRVYTLLWINLERFLSLSIKYGMTDKNGDKVYDLSSQIEFKI